MRPIATKIISVGKNAMSALKKMAIFLTVIIVVLFLFNYLSTGQKIPLEPQTELQSQAIQNMLVELESNQTDKGRLELFVYQNGFCNFLGEGCSEKYGNERYSNNGLIQKMANLIVIPYENPPASALGWAQVSMEKVGFIPSTYAYSGVGFSSLSGYMEIWKLFREISYIILVLVMITIGFLIMFRVKIGSQAEISIQNALPRIVVAMILIAFSFPIAGFLVDIMYVIMAIVVHLIFDAGIAGTTSETAGEVVDSYINGGFFKLFPPGQNWYTLGQSMYGLMPWAIRGGIQLIGYFFVVSYIKQITHFIGEFTKDISGLGVIGNIWGNLPGLAQLLIQLVIFFAVFPIIPGVILMLVMMLTALLFVFKIFFLLLSSYIKVVLYVIFSPVILMFSAIPGVNTIGWWFKNLFGELLAFPTVAMILMVGRAMATVNQINSPSGVNGLYIRTSLIPHYVEPFRLPFLHGISSSDLNTLIGLGLILMTPDLIKMVKGWVGVTDNGLNIGLGTFMAGAGIFTAGIGAASQIDSMKTGIMGRDPMERQKGIVDLLPWVRKGKSPGGS
ncbi:hypothetical protein COY16_03850 [Candidatus Roizmanbacteria bacterium CG_4_10_14_0_2_um_filter_39_13]|uniref:Uncharacterized protein n=1 Tax=Candidatus Roizmanbacteria bacterium CG_4_10_14_0_2_um_filter_39_13 TaxID=1974825 RepID=A0A2M7TY78_9BACT|nr:MAG: hypothetical protein COY16_03850 [Candidatus Roizmanbacteria bacterium CG_4_10_14_0_2_um_filter_39_13]